MLIYVCSQAKASEHNPTAAQQKTIQKRSSRRYYIGCGELSGEINILIHMHID